MRKLLVVAAAAWWLWPHRAAPDLALQLGVTTSGFVARVGGEIVALDADGRPLRRAAPDLPRDVRVAGARGDHIVVGFRDPQGVALGTLADDGAIEDVTHWGNAVDHLCDGVASNDARFAVAWAEDNGAIMFVHGPGPLTAATAAPKGWCAIASAGENIALLWRDSGRTLLNFCSRESCKGRVLTLPIERTDALIAYGCVDAACLFAVRHRGGDAALLRLTARGQLLELPFEASGAVAIVGTGDAFAIAHDGEVERVAMDGARTPLDRISADGAPALAWGHGRLLVAAPLPGGDVVYVVVR